VSSVTDMSVAFSETNFNFDLSTWDVSSVRQFYEMFYASQFDGDISNWNVSSAENMAYMFKYTIQSRHFLMECSKCYKYA